MRIGIITLYYRTYNYGAQLQAYALQRVISNLGHKCEIIRFLWCGEETVESYRNATVDHNKFIEFSNKIPHSARVYDSVTISECVEDYDAFVVGSDQVWGVEKSMPVIKLPIMNLCFAGENKVKIAYAASLGGSNAPSKIEEVLAEELKNFDFISVREKSAIKYLSNLTDKEIAGVLDPVFLLGVDNWSNMVDRSLDDGSYVLYYTVGADDKQKYIINAIQSELGMQVKHLGYIDGNPIGPMEFIRLIKNAEYIVTDSFHATAFSIIFNKNFVALPVDNVPTERSRNIRITDMLETLSLSDRYVAYEHDIENIPHIICAKLRKNIEWTVVNKVMEEEVKHSENYLKNALGYKKIAAPYLCDKRNCTGCGACFSVCPVNAISMIKDGLGFSYPCRDLNKCKDCGKCKEACNFTGVRNGEIDVMGLQSKDTLGRENSSAGGVFGEIATRIIENGGLVAACRFDSNYGLIHDFCDSVELLDEFRRSKYVQSDAYVLFPEIKRYLSKAVEVLFVGTPCQTYALVSYLGNIPENLYLIDLICGGVTAPGLWDKYKTHISKIAKPTSITMRHKYASYLNAAGFPAFSMRLGYEDKTIIREGEEDLFLRARLNFYRESCYHCKYKGKDRVSDITLGDFVGMEKSMPEKYDGLGTTLTIVRTPKGERLLYKCSEKFDVISISENIKQKVLDDNINLYSSMHMKPQSYYLRSVFENSSIERLFYEDKRWDEYNAGQEYLKILFRDSKRNELLLKAERFRRYQLLIDDSPCIAGNVYIYGAGKLGRSLVRCSGHVSGFIDENTSITSCAGLPVFRKNSDELKKKLFDRSTVIVTPVWDFDVIKDELFNLYPNINIVSAVDILESVWL